MGRRTFAAIMSLTLLIIFGAIVAATAPFTRVPVSPFPAGEAQGESVCWNPGRPW